jgi:hypothetical protein
MTGIGTYIDLVNPYKFRETIERETAVDNPTGVFINAFILASLSVLLALAMSYAQNAKIGIYSLSLSPQAYNHGGTPLDIAVTFCIALFSTFITPFVFNGMAKLLGGDGSFWKVAWPQTSISVVYSLVSIPPMALALLISAYVYCVVMIPLFVGSIYTYYLFYKIIRASHKSLSRNKAIATIIAGTILAIAIFGAIQMVRALYGI